MDIVFASLGSKGNATLIQEGDTLIQVDMGVTLKSVARGLKILNRDFNDIQALFVTHEHSDHIGGLGLYHGRVPVYCGEGTLPDIDEEHILEEGISVEVGDLTILPFCSSHDAYNPMNFIIFGGGKKFGYVTDTGTILKTGQTLLYNCDYYLMESNYGVYELAHGKYPEYLKKRIRSKVGHLSNIDSAKFCASFIGPKTKQVFLGHISDENNHPEIALTTYREVFEKKGISKDIKITAIPQLTLQIGGDLL